MIDQFHPVLPLLVGAFLSLVLLPSGRQFVAMISSCSALYFVTLLSAESQISLEMAGQTITLLSANKLSLLFATAFSLYGVIASVFSWRDTDAVSKSASLLLIAGGVGVSLAGDWLSLYLFWEMLTVSSLLLIWKGASEESYAAGYRYLMLHLFGGVVLLLGVLLNYQSSGSFALIPFDLATDGLASWLILFGILVNGAVVPLHAWITDSYPRATIFGTVLLSAFTSKGAVYVLARTFPGAEVLIYLGALTLVVGTIYALLENDLRRILVYSIVVQIGYMVVAIGIGNGLSLNGSAAHAFAHIFYKGLLLMSIGAVIYSTGCKKLTEVGSLLKPAPLLLVFYLIGALSISGLPFFSGFISKSMIAAAVSGQGLAWLDGVLLFASAGTVIHTVLKLPWFTFLSSNNASSQTSKVPLSMYFSMFLAAAVCLCIGFSPDLLYPLLPFEFSDFDLYTDKNIVKGCAVVGVAAVVFFLVRNLITPRDTSLIDVDVIYRRPLSNLLRLSSDALAGIGSFTTSLTDSAVKLFLRKLALFRVVAVDGSTFSSQVAILFILFCSVLLAAILF